MKRLVAWTAALWAAMAGLAMADSPVVVELYTSQGCSSCPSADKILGQLADRDDVIALALHVDYWDYIGWKDQFADPQFTTRQRAYARAAGTRRIYTPQMIIGGKDHVIGNRPMKVTDTIRKHSRTKQAVDVTLKRNGDRVVIEAEALKNIGGAVVHLVTYQDQARVKITRGENAGRTLNYHNIAREWLTLGKWDGRADYKSSVKVAKGTPVVVLVQARDAGPILGASRLR